MHKPIAQSRRQFQKLAGAATCGTAFIPTLLSASPKERATRRVLAMSDLHIGNYTSMVRSTEPLLHLDGNVAWFFLSDEEESREGNLTDATLTWLKAGLTEHQDMITVVCSHQLVANTVRQSHKAAFQLHPVDKLQGILDFKNGAREIQMRRRDHDHHRFMKEFEVTIPLRTAYRFPEKG